MGIAEKMAKARLRKLAGKALENGLLTEDDLDRMAGELVAESKQRYREEAARESAQAKAKAAYTASHDVCANCTYFSDFMGCYCSKHQYSFSVSEENDRVQYRRTCGSFRSK